VLRVLLLVAVASAGCAYTEDKYTEEVSAEICRINGPACFALFDSVESCLEADDGTAIDPECEFDAAAAKDCVDGWQVMTCPSTPSDLVIPSACADVYQCASEDSGS
jgi:hypothetical protein